MLEMANPGKLRPPSEPHRKTADPTPVKLEIEDQLEDEYGPLDKKSRMSSHFQQQWDTSASMAPPVMPYDLLDEPSPLGLRLRKSPSLLDLIQMRLSQADSASTSCITSCENAEVGKKDLKSTAASGSIDKMKASNFPATLLRIGTWECVSRYEGDLVAKCYYAKHKLVWEVLEGGLKSKIEVQWSDITSLKATCPENGPGTLDIVLARQPLFFRETNPQPRKHTLWQTTADFTKGQASICRRHFLECAQGLLNKHFEKLIQCDPRLNALSRQPDIMLESLYFEPRCSVFEDQDEYKCHASDNLKDGCGPMGSMFRDLGSPSVAPSVCTTSEARDPIGRTPDNLPQGTPPTSGFSAMEDNSGSKTRELKVAGLGASMSMSDLVSHMEKCISGNTGSDNPFLSPDGSPNKGMLEGLTQYLLSDSQMSTSDEQSLMFRVNSLRCLLQKDEKPLVVGPTPVFDLRGLGLEEDEASAYKQPPPSISRKESFGELLMHLPRIASLPQVLFNITEDAENRE